MVSVAPSRPHAVQRARRLSTSLDASDPQRMTGAASAIGAACEHVNGLAHHSQTQQALRRRSPNVGTGPAGSGFVAFPVGDDFACGSASHPSKLA